MELGTSTIAVLWFLGLGLIILVPFLLYIIRKERQRDKRIALPYNEAKTLAYQMLKERYSGHKGFYKSYQKEYGFDKSLGTLRKALQPTNPTPNIRYVQRVLDDLKPGHYKVLPPNKDDTNQAA